MKIDPRLEWVRPYLDLASDLVDLTDLREIKVITVTENKKQTLQGELVDKVFLKRKPRCEIRLATKYQKWKVKGIKGFGKMTSLADYSAIDILVTLAHELSHMSLVHKFNDYTHTPNHKILECVIAMRFMVKLNEDGYVSEENEKELLK